MNIALITVVSSEVRSSSDFCISSVKVFLVTILTKSWHPIGTPLAVKGLASPLLLLPGAGLAGIGTLAGAMVVVAGLMSVEEGVTVAAVDMLLEALVMLVHGDHFFGVALAEGVSRFNSFYKTENQKLSRLLPVKLSESNLPFLRRVI